VFCMKPWLQDAASYYFLTPKRRPNTNPILKLRFRMEFVLKIILNSFQIRSSLPKTSLRLSVFA
jgi:hypothetical protein